MWRTVIFTLAASSAISNIELLIPLTVSRLEAREVDGEDSDEDHQIDRDEPYSAIPAFAFTLDTDPIPAADRTVQSSTNFPSLPPPELIPHRSWYLNNIHQRPQDTGTKKQVPHKRSEQIERLKEEKRKGCRALADQHSAEARELLLYFCTELVDLLTSRCDCCEEDQHLKKSRSIASMPWFGTIGIKNRARNQQALDDDQDDR
ncbi:unnamed protein product [Arctia plantaginis]|uniref:Uncharacterized protein n=1 Tax=Arctia plantaginis TaxID=874455 RepID=A0A8S1AC70_ARCPL|nr:unnamed protein product [Arctia plantaginis]